MNVENIVSAESEQLLAVRIRLVEAPAGLRFCTPESGTMQVATISRKAGDTVKRHKHPQHARTVLGTPETLAVHSGKLMAYVYNEHNKLAWSDTIGPGEVLVLLGDGHELVFLEDCVLLEVKQGPYLGVLDKVYF